MALHKRKGLGVKPWNPQKKKQQQKHMATHVLITPLSVFVGGDAGMGVGWRQEVFWDLLDATLASGPVKDSRE